MLINLAIKPLGGKSQIHSQGYMLYGEGHFTVVAMMR